MAISTHKVFLMEGTGTGSLTYSKLVDIKDFPDLGGAPELLETTTLTDAAQTYIPGIQSMDVLEFTANYTKADYTTLKALEGDEIDLAVWFGGTESAGVTTPDGADGKFDFKGYLTVYPVGGGVSEVIDMKINVAPSTVITAS